jgi:hypothetical protein
MPCSPCNGVCTKQNNRRVRGKQGGQDEDNKGSGYMPEVRGMALIIFYLGIAVVANLIFRFVLAALTIAAGIGLAIIIQPVIGMSIYAGIILAAFITFMVGYSVRKLQYSMA